MTETALAKLRPDLFFNTRVARRTLVELVRDKELIETPLYRNRSCFFAREPKGETEDFSEAGKIRAYAILAVCASSSANRTRVTRQEFQNYFPETYRPGLPMNYYVELGSRDPVLGFVRLDRGGPGRWDRLVAKALNDARRHRLEPAFERFIEKNALEIRVVTALPQKADRLRRALTEKVSRANIPIHVSVVPELINLIAPIPS